MAQKAEAQGITNGNNLHGQPDTVPAGKNGEVLSNADNRSKTLAQNGNNVDGASHRDGDNRGNNPVAGSDTGGTDIGQMAADDEAQTGRTYSARLSAQSTAPLSAQPNTQPSAQLIGATAIYNKSLWKRSRVKKGWLIKRLTGYSIAETEYGVSYLWVLSRKPDKTCADNSVWSLAGYFNWKSLEASGLLRREKKTK